MLCLVFSLRRRVLVCNAADTASLATWFPFGKLFGVATLVGFGEKRCRKNLPLCGRDRMRTHFSQLFWGLLLVILDFTINGFDLLPDGLGYLVVAAGCGGLSALSPRFSTARSLCFVLAVLWLVGFAIHGDIATLYGFATTLVNCAFIWQLLGGIGEFAMDRGRSDLAGRAHNRRLAYVAIMIGTTLLAFMMNGSRDAGPLVVVLVVSMLILMVMILHLIHRTKVELAA